MEERDFDLRDQPAYAVSEAARYLRLPSATLRSWIVGRDYPAAGRTAHFSALIQPARREPLQLSFYNLIESHVLRSLRTEHGVAIKEVREAIRFAERHLGIERLLLSRELRTHAGEVFLEKYGALLNLSASGQLAMRRLLAEHLKRVEWDDRKFPIRLYPFTPGELSFERSIAIDPAIAFGRPIVVRAGISTITIAERLDAGESVGDLAEDYGLSEAEIEEAVLYERAA
ncbi:MAG: DUF433 domain-containing protein [Thermoanaerobaculia bacterium]